MILDKSVNASQKLVLANDHEARSNNSKDQDKEKYFQTRWWRHILRRGGCSAFTARNRRKKRWRS